jgi:hypothetical protein
MSPRIPTPAGILLLITLVLSGTVVSAKTHMLQLGTRKITTDKATTCGTPVIPMWRAPMPVEDGSKTAGFPVLKEAEHSEVWRPSTRRDGAYNHYSCLSYHDGYFYAMWGNHPFGEDGPGQRALFSSSKDGRKWSPAAEFCPAPGPVLKTDQHGIHLKPDRWVVVDGKLYGIVYVHGAGIYPIARELGANGKPGAPFLLRTVPEDGRLPSFMPEAREDPDLAAKIKQWYIDNDTLSWWAHSAGERIVHPRGIDGAMMIEPFMYRSRSGLVVLQRSFQKKGEDPVLNNRLYASFPDGKGGWSKPYPTDIPDAPSRAQARALPDGRVLLIGNQIAPRFDDGLYLARDPLTLSVSPDGETFDRVFALCAGASKGPRFSGITGRARGTAFGYPSMIIHDGMLHVLYSIHKEDMAVSSVSLDSIK